MFDLRHQPMQTDADRDDPRERQREAVQRIVDVQRQVDDVTAELQRTAAIGQSLRSDAEHGNPTQHRPGERGQAQRSPVDQVVIPGLLALREMANALETMQRAAVMGGATADFVRTASSANALIERATALMRAPGLAAHPHGALTAARLRSLTTPIDRVTLSTPSSSLSLGSTAADVGMGSVRAEAETAQRLPQAVATLASSGQPLPRVLRLQLERVLRTDLSAVQVHHGQAAAAAAAQQRADAFAVGAHIFFAAGKFAPQSRAGRWLVAHEVAHTVQQRGSAVRVMHFRPDAARDADEAAADSTADAVTADADHHSALAERANARFGPDAVALLRTTVGLPRRGSLDAEFMAAVASLRSGGAAATTPESAATAPHEITELDWPTLRDLPFFALSRHYNPVRNWYAGADAPWADMEPARRDVAIQALRLALEVAESDIAWSASETRSRLVVTPHFVQRAVAWQIWRRVEGELDGKLGNPALLLLGVPASTAGAPSAELVESLQPPESLETILSGVRATNSTVLIATETALSRAALHGLDLERNYEFPLNERSRCARGIDLARIANEVRQLRRLAGTGRATVEDVERRQDWSRYALTSDHPISTVGTDADRVSAVSRNAALGFSPAVIQALWRVVVPGETHRRSFFTREFTDALFDQGIGENGVLTEAALQRLHIAEAFLHDSNPAAHYRNSDFWQNMPDAEFETVAAAVARRFEGFATSLQRAHSRRAPRRITVDPQLALAIANWQVWNRRGETVQWGFLDRADVELLGIATTTPLATDADASVTPATDAATDIAADTLAATRLTATELRSGLHERLSTLVSARRAEAQAHRRSTVRPRRGRGHAESVTLEETPSVVSAAVAEAQLVEYVETVVRPTMATIGSWSPAQSVRRSEEPVVAWTNRIVVALGEFIGDNAHSADEAATVALRDMGILLGEGALVREGWDARLSGSGPTGRGHAEREAARAAAAAGLPVPHIMSVEERATELEPQLRTFREGLQRLLAVVVPALRQRPPQTDVAIAAIREASSSGELAPPTLVRHVWRATWPSLPAQDGTLAQARAWQSALQTALRTSTRELAITESYEERIVNTNPDAVMVDLNLLGVEITNNNGNALPRSDMHLDPVFALQMARFVSWLSSQGVIRMWTSGFLRNAMSAQDTHPMGMACDVTGFTFAEQHTVIHLRSGLPARTSPAPADHAAPTHAAPTPELSAPNENAGGDDGHSDWFDHTSMLNGRSHAHIMMGIAAQMTNYFDRIIGPGHNPEHMNHFHVETSPGGPRADGLRLFAMSSESTHLSEVARHAADARDANWDANIEPLPLLAPRHGGDETSESDE